MLGLVTDQFDRQRRDNPVPDVVLQFEYVVQSAVITLGPKMVAGLGIDQLGGDAYALAGSANAALQQELDAQIRGDVLYLGRGTLVRERRVARDNGKIR